MTSIKKHFFLESDAEIWTCWKNAYGHRNAKATQYKYMCTVT